MRYFSFDQTIGESKIYGFGGKSGGGTPVIPPVDEPVIPIPTDYLLRYDFNGDIAESSIGVATTTNGSVAFSDGRKVGTQSADMSSGYINTTDRQTLGVSTVSASFWVNLLPTFSGSVLSSAKPSVLEYRNAFVASINASNGSVDLMQHSKYGMYSNSVANSLQSGVWTHVLLEINRSPSSSVADKEVIYINNMKASTKGIHTSAVASALENGHIYIGDIGLGKIQDLRIYSRLLTETERLALFQE